MNKKQGVIVIVSFTAALLIGASAAQASVLDDVWRFLGGKAEPKVATSTVGTTSALEKTGKNEVSFYKPAEDYEEAVVAAVERAAPAVVSIVISKDVPRIEACPYDPFGDFPPDVRRFFSNDLGPRFYAECERGTEKREIAGGTGFIVSPDGLIVTNKHVVLDAKAEYTVFTNDGKKHSAAVVARNPVQDIALLKISAPGLKAAALGDSDTLKLGQTAIAIGNALGEFRNTVSVGVVSGLARTITAGGAGFSETIEGVIQTDAAINQGNSGGPILNLKGEVVGVNTAVASDAQNIGFAIPINEIKRSVESVKKTGTIKVSYLGVRTIVITSELAEKEGLPVKEGALVRGSSDGPGVVPGSPAERAGLQAEDIITAVSGVKITKDNPPTSIIQRYGVGDIITLSIRRGAKTISVKVKLEERL